MNDPVEIARTASIILGIIGILLCILALSLRRIADALEKIAEKETKNVVYLPADFQLPDSLRQDIQTMSWEAGRNFQHGMRTDR